MGTPYKVAIQTKGATFRLILTDHRGRVTEQTATSPREWLAKNNAALNANQFHPKTLEGKRGPDTCKDRYVRCQSICVLPSGEEVPCGSWQKVEALPRRAAPMEVTEQAADVALMRTLAMVL